MKREIFTEEHDQFRDQFRRFADREIVPQLERWAAQGMVDREFWRKLGREGFLGVTVDPEYGGAGADFLYDAILFEEIADIRAHGLAIGLHDGVCLPYITTYGNEDQKQRFLPGVVNGDVVLGICMTEPGTGSDVAGIQTTARRDGDHYVLNGSKIFISNGQLGDVFVTAAKTGQGRSGISMFLVEATSPGFVRGRNLEKLGLKAQDTSELFFEDCRVPAANLLGEEGQGFKMMMEKLQQERLVICIAAVPAARRSLLDTVEYVKSRKAFGQSIAGFQNTQFRLAELATEIEIGQAFVDRLLKDHVAGKEIVSEVSMGKWWTTDLWKKTAAQCLQLHGGYGFMLEYPISMDLADSLVQSIYAGTNEIMKVIIARRMGLGV